MRMHAHSTKILVPPDGSLLRKRVILGGSVAGSILTGLKKQWKRPEVKQQGPDWNAWFSERHAQFNWKRDIFGFLISTFQSHSVLECWSRGTKNLSSRLKWSLLEKVTCLRFISLQPRVFTDYQREKSGFWQVLWSHDWKESSCIWKICVDKIPLRQQYSKQRISNGVFSCCATL